MPSNGADLPPDAARATLGAIARVLTGRYGVTVSFDKTGPRVAADAIVLPDMPVSNAHDIAVLTGYVDLLVARSRFSDNPAIVALGPGVTQRIAQVIEDRRVCQRLFDAYPGAKSFIDELREHRAHALRQKWSGLAWRDKLIWLIERALWNETPDLTEQSDALLATLNAAGDSIAQAAKSRSTRESIAASRALVARIRALGEGDVNTMMFTADADETLDAEQSSSDSDSRDDAANPDSTSSDAVTPGQSAPGETAEASEAFDVAMPAAPSGIEMIEHRPRLSIPLSTEFDRIADLTGTGDAAAWRKLRALARAETGPLTARLERALRADELTHWKREQERGDIDRAALVKLATTPAYRTPFRVKRRTEGRDSAVSILIDRSGSMAGRKIDLARLCAAALCDALLQLGFECEVLGYSSVESRQMRELGVKKHAEGADLAYFNRCTERLDFEIYKRFGSQNPVGLASIECGHENPDGEAIVWASSRLIAQRARRRILMVLSDGYPATGDGHPVILRTDLEARIQQAEQMGIELIGVGILDDAVEKFYAHNIVVRKLDELPAMAFDVLSRALLHH